MDPRTFLPPPPLRTAQAPGPGDAAPPLPVSLPRGRPAIVAFIRHTGCPFAEATLRALRDIAGAHPDIAAIAISHAPADETEKWCRAIGGRGDVWLASDSSRRTYADWGLGRTGLGHFLGRRSLAGAARLARRGIRNRHPHGTRWQSAGTFALDAEAIVRWRHLPDHAGDLPDLAAAVRALK
jgi:hypothetical protein